MNNFFSQEMIAFLASRYEKPNNTYDIAGFICGEKYKGFKRLKPPEQNEYTSICEILFLSFKETKKKYDSLTWQDQYSVTVAGRLSFLMGMAALYNGEQGHWKVFKDILIKKGVESVSSDNLVTWINDNTKNSKENGEIYRYVFEASSWGILHILETDNKEAKDSLIKKIKP